MKKKRVNICPEKILQELAQIGFARVPDYVDIRDDAPVIRDLRDLSGAAIASIEKSSGGWKVKFYDKLKALELLGKHFGLFSGELPREEQTSNLLECILKAMEEEVDTGDIPELQQAAAAGDELVEKAEAEKF